MQVQHASLNKYRSAMLRLPVGKALTKEDLLSGEFLMERHGQVTMYYAPHNEYVNPDARIVMIGITPGWTQMKLSYEAAVRGMALGLPDEQVCRLAQDEARFAGSMRSHMINMLNELGLHQLETMKMNSSEELFTTRRDWLHTTSLLRYPVFVQGKNYTGSQPDLLATSYLLDAIRRDHVEELHIWNRSLVIPLGRTVERFLRIMVQEGKLDETHCLWNFPHPSGANGHRHKQFAAHREEMKHILHAVMRSKR